MKITIGHVRLGIGVLQGMALYLLYRGIEAPTASQLLWLDPLRLAALFIPPFVILAFVSPAARTLLISAGGAAIMLFLFGLQDAARRAPSESALAYQDFFAKIFPSPQLTVFTAVGAFISLSLILSGVADNRRIASYQRHFDIGWKLAIQLLLAAGFSAILWGHC